MLWIETAGTSYSPTESEIEVVVYSVDVNQPENLKGETMWTKRIAVLFGVALVGLLAATAVSAGSDANSRKGKAYFKRTAGSVTTARPRTPRPSNRPNSSSSSGNVHSQRKMMSPSVCRG